MGVSLLTYVVSFFIFSINYALTLCALIFPKWITFATPVPFYMETNYGLFKSCRSMSRDCRPFPSQNYNDCEEEGFCEIWRGSAAGMVAAAIMGGLIIIALIATMCSERRKRSRAWGPLIFMFLVFASLQVVAMSGVAYLYNTSNFFYMGSRYNFSFVLCIISWTLTVILSIVISMIALLGPPEYYYQSLN
ncbi:hypothetical protein BDB01DRAFT_791282 [Pilobolus umbonatus]|nr:hypothetical protein BDB01DRAFT_791282 [Pilobolus umbonatus]